MAFIAWTEEWEIKIPQLDAHHKQLVSFINSFHDAIDKGQGDIAVYTILPELLNYTMYHFVAEEEIMEKYSYPQYKTHKEEHKFLVNKTINFYEKYNAGNTNITSAVFDFMNVFF